MLPQYLVAAILLLEWIDSDGNIISHACIYKKDKTLHSFNYEFAYIISKAIYVSGRKLFRQPNTYIEEMDL